MTAEELKTDMLAQGYFDLVDIPGRGLCGLRHFAFTIGLVYGLNEYNYEGRYCFDDLYDAREALTTWDGKRDPAGNWLVHKGDIEYSNPAYGKDLDG